MTRKRTKSLAVLALLACMMLLMAGCASGSGDGEVSSGGAADRTNVSQRAEGGTQSSEETEAQAETPKQAKKQKKPKKEPAKPVPAEDELVKVREYIPDIVVELKYATEDNFTRTVIYDFSEAYLRYGTVKKLKNVQKAVKKDGYSLKIWDAYRPVSAQFKLWEVCPDESYVANPNGGYSSHSRGNTVDITLCDSAGHEVEMPTGFDDFTAKADRDYRDCSKTEREHVTYLERQMTARGFDPYVSEWWHFADLVSYPVQERLPRKASK